MTYFEDIGGEPVLSTIIRIFVQRVTTDPMIGFFFRGVDHDRLACMEYQFTARFLGADVEYEGKPVREAHAKHPIMGGQFDRRRQILKEVIREFGIQEEIEAAWLEHVDRLRPLVTSDGKGECDETSASDRIPPRSKPGQTID